MSEARVLIGLEDVSVGFGEKPLFEGLRLHVLEGDRICLVGRNGSGKTTLMRLIAGLLPPDEGTRFCHLGTMIGYLQQTIAYDPQATVRELVIQGLPIDVDAPEALAYAADRLIVPLDLDPHAPLASLSGGQLRRAALAQALMLDPDLLLLDEPTNHLDLSAVEWLETYLRNYRGALVCVSHDRAFLKNVSRKVFWLDQGTVRVCPRGYAQFDAWAETIVEQEARALHNAQKKLAAELDWTQGGVTARRKRNQRRLGELHRLREKLRADAQAHARRHRTIDVDGPPPGHAAKIMIEFKNVTHAFNDADRTVPILQDFNFRILRGDRIGILGKNGSGKSTFLKLAIGALTPNAGTVFRSHTLDLAYFDQHRVLLDPSKTLWQTLCPNGGDQVFIGGDANRAQHVCGYLKNFLFDPKIARDPVATLSGGQQSRLMLAKLLTAPGNLLILDEPTNDLDADTLDMLQEVLADYAGTLLLVSHDRDFLDRTVTRVLAFEGAAQVEHVIGGYSDYLQAVQKSPATPSKPTASRLAASRSTVAPPVVKAVPAFSGKLRHELEKLPEKIAALEREAAAVEASLTDDTFYRRDPEGFVQAGRQLARLRGEIEQAETRWLELEELRARHPGRSR